MIFYIYLTELRVKKFPKYFQKTFTYILYENSNVFHKLIDFLKSLEKFAPKIYKYRVIVIIVSML